MNGSATAGASRRRWLSSLTGNLLFGTRFVTIWIAMIVLLVVCKIVAPQHALERLVSSLLPLATIAIVALGQMLVIMMGGIDLSIAGHDLAARQRAGRRVEGQNDRLRRR